MLDEAGRLRKVFLDKANHMSQGIGRFAQQVVHARVRMDLNSGDASAKMQEIQSLTGTMVLLATEAEKAQNAAVAGGQTAAGVATQLLAAGAVDSERPEAYEEKESEAEVGRASSKRNTCAVVLQKGPRKNELCGRPCPCRLHRATAGA